MGCESLVDDNVAGAAGGQYHGADARRGVSVTSQDYFSPLTVYNAGSVTASPGTSTINIENYFCLFLASCHKD